MVERCPRTRGRAQKRSNRWPILIALAVLIGGAWVAKTFLTGPAEPLNILLLGVDEGQTRTDVVVLAHVDPKQNRVSLLSLPRDTLVEIDCGSAKPCQSPDKLAHAHAYGGKNGPAFAMKSVSNLLGVKVDHYVRVDYAGFQAVVDRLGGVEILIDHNMDYEDPYAHPPLRIHFKASTQPQHLDGEDALRYVRFRADGLGDIGRIERTKRFALALIETSKKNGSIAQWPGLVNALWPYLSTDLDLRSAVALAKVVSRTDPAHMDVEILPGKDDPNSPRGWVWVADRAKAREVVERMGLAK